MSREKPQLVKTNLPEQAESDNPVTHSLSEIVEKAAGPIFRPQLLLYRFQSE